MEFAALTRHEQELIDLARDTIDARGDGETHTVAAAVQDVNGRNYTGVNFYHFTGGPCAELVALANAHAQGAAELATIVAVGDGGRGVLAPCGRDRQVLMDHHPDIRVIMPTATGPGSVRVRALLPGAYAFRFAGQRLRFTGDNLAAVRSGAKQATIRYRDRVDLGPVTMVFDSEPEVVLRGEIIEVLGKRLREVTDDEAREAGNADHADLLARLPRHYPGITGEDVVTIVRYRLAD